MKYRWQTKLKKDNQGGLSEEPLSPVKRVHELDMMGRHRSEWIYSPYDKRNKPHGVGIDPFELPSYTIWKQKKKM